MTQAVRKPVIYSAESQAKWLLVSLNFLANLEKSDRKCGREYVPMDVYVDPRIIEDHFQAASIRARAADVHLSAA